MFGQIGLLQFVDFSCDYIVVAFWLVPDRGIERIIEEWNWFMLSLCQF